MTYQFGTSYFVSKSWALKYYMGYLGYVGKSFWRSKEQRSKLQTYVNELLESGTIHVGKPPATLGEITGVNAEGRYMIRSYVG